PPGVVNKTVNPPVARERGFDEVLYVFRLPHVAEDEVSVACSLFAREGLERARDRRALCLDVAADDDLRARADELVRASFPDAAAAAGDEYNLVRVTHVRHRDLPRLTDAHGDRPL